MQSSQKPIPARGSIQLLQCDVSLRTTGHVEWQKFFIQLTAALALDLMSVG